MTEKEILQQQESNGQKTFYLMAVGMFYHAYGCGAFALARATGYRVLRKQRKYGDVLVCGFPANQLDMVLQRIRENSGEVEQTGEKTFLFRGLDGTADETMVHARADLQSCRSEYKHLQCDNRTTARPLVACYRRDARSPYTHRTSHGVTV